MGRLPAAVRTDGAGSAWLASTSAAAFALWVIGRYVLGWRVEEDIALLVGVGTAASLASCGCFIGRLFNRSRCSQPWRSPLPPPLFTLRKISPHPPA